MASNDGKRCYYDELVKMKKVVAKGDPREFMDVKMNLRDADAPASLGDS